MLHVFSQLPALWRGHCPLAVDVRSGLSSIHVSLDSSTNPKAVIVRIKASKTNQFRQGVNVYLGRTDNDLCWRILLFEAWSWVLCSASRTTLS